MTPAVAGAIDSINRMRTLNPFRVGVCKASGSAPGPDLVTTKSPLKIAQYRICLRRVNPVPDQLRMATLTPGGRISTQVVDEETSRLSSTWHKPDILNRGMS